MAGELFKLRAGIDMTHVPYKAAGRRRPISSVDTCRCFSPGRCRRRRRSRPDGMKPLAVASLERSPAFPDLPTIAEEALPGYEPGIWWGVLAPAATPRDIVM